MSHIFGAAMGAAQTYQGFVQPRMERKEAILKEFDANDPVKALQLQFESDQISVDITAARGIFENIILKVLQPVN